VLSAQGLDQLLVVGLVAVLSQDAQLALTLQGSSRQQVGKRVRTGDDPAG
jgi:hypothetical protein